MIAPRIRVVALPLCLVLAGCAGEVQPAAPARALATTAPAAPAAAPTAAPVRVKKSDAEWRAQLSDDEYRITRQKGTERAFTGKYWDTKEPGVYHCVCCDQPLYASTTKFDSGTGWPSFWAPVAEDAIATESDRTLGMLRVELMCSRCDAHLGHVFDDGPPPTGKRHCLNSAALRLVPEQPDAEK